jgi:hypothetical protein
MEFEEIIESVQQLSTEQLQAVRLAVDKELSEKRLEEIQEALKQAKQPASQNKLKYYSSGEEFLLSLNED